MTDPRDPIVEDQVTVARLAREAVAIQDASNLRGVLLAWHKAICNQAVARGGQVEEFLNLLYLGKVTSLIGANADSIGDAYSGSTTWSAAYEWAKRVSGVAK